MTSLDYSKSVADHLLAKQPRVVIRKIEVDGLFHTFSQGLRAYTREASTKENDQKVRGSWAKIEDVLRRYGRNI